MHLRPLNSFIIRRIFRRVVRSAYTESEPRILLSEAGFLSAGIRADGIGFEVWLHQAALISLRPCGSAKFVWSSYLSNHSVIWMTRMKTQSSRIVLAGVVLLLALMALLAGGSQPACQARRAAVSILLVQPLGY